MPGFQLPQHDQIDQMQHMTANANRITSTIYLDSLTIYLKSSGLCSHCTQQLLLVQLLAIQWHDQSIPEQMYDEHKSVECDPMVPTPPYNSIK